MPQSLGQSGPAAQRAIVSQRMRRAGLTLLSALLLLVPSTELSLAAVAAGVLSHPLCAQGLRSVRAFRWGWVMGLIANLGGQRWTIALLMRFGKNGVVELGAGAAARRQLSGLVFACWAWGTRLLVTRTRIPLAFAGGVSMVAAESVIHSVPWSLRSCSCLLADHSDRGALRKRRDCFLLDGRQWAGVRDLATAVVVAARQAAFAVIAVVIAFGCSNRGRHPPDQRRAQVARRRRAAEPRHRPASGASRKVAGDNRYTLERLAPGRATRRTADRLAGIGVAASGPA